MLSTSLVAQQTAAPPPAAPVVAPAPTAEPLPGATNAPPAKTAKKKTTAKPAKKSATAKPALKKAPAEKKSAPAAVETPIVLVAGPAVIASSNVNVRGQAALRGEVVARLNKGEPVTVLEQINLEKHKAGEPAQWAKIAFPTNAQAWVNTTYIDATNKTVLPKKLNLRAGPGENYSVVGLLEKGALVREIKNKDNWMEIEAPTNAYAFVAAEYLKQEAPVVAAAPAPATPAPTPAPVVPTTVAEAPTVASTPTEAPAAAPAATPAPAQVEPPAAAPAPATPLVVEEPLPKRIVQHEGVVRSTWSIQAPTKYALVDPASGRTVDYLYTTTTNLDLNHYKGLHIVVTGEEGLDERWGNTPVITIQQIRVVE